AVEGHVGENKLYLGGIVAAAFEEALPPRHFLGLDLRHQPRGFRLWDERGARRLERRIAEMVIAMEMAVDHPLDRFVRDLANASDEVVAVARVLARVDHEDALAGGQDDRVRRTELE